ncbi:MAG: hypothetical protein ABSD71_14190 [Bacteroidales bacterium]
MMKAILFIFLISIITIDCMGQETAIEFDKFLSKFPNCSTPIDTKNYFSSMGIYANNPNNIREKELYVFLESSQEKFWKYKLYSDSIHNYFNYVIGCRLNISDSIVGLLYFRTFFSETLSEEKSELVLCVCNIAGKMISNLPIAGSYGDDVNFSSNIHSFDNIEVNFIEYQNDKKKEYTKFYSITKEGRIINND